MSEAERDARRRFRVWIAGYENWRPGGWQEVPPRAVALEPAEEGSLSAAEAAAYVEGFNQTTLARCDRRWAIAVPVLVRYEGDLEPGRMVMAPPAKGSANRPSAPDTAGTPSSRPSGG